MVELVKAENDMNLVIYCWWVMRTGGGVDGGSDCKYEIFSSKETILEWILSK